MEPSNYKQEIKYPFEQGIPKQIVVSAKVDIEHLQCPICFNILWKPVACSQEKCYSSFCEPCIKLWLNDSIFDSQNSNNNSNMHNDMSDLDELDEEEDLIEQENYMHQSQQQQLQIQIQEEEDNIIIQDQNSNMHSPQQYIQQQWYQSQQQKIQNNRKKCPKCKRKFKKTTLPLVNSLLSSVILNCINKDQGCQEQIPYDSFEKHVQQCQYKEIQCIGCNQNFIQKDYEFHKNECEKILVNCPKCNKELQRIQLRQNHNEIRCLEYQNEKKDLKIQQLKNVTQDLQYRLQNIEELVQKMVKGEPENIHNLVFSTVFTSNFSFSQREAKLIQSSWNHSKQKLDFLHFYMNKEIRTQGIMQTQFKIKLQNLKGNLLFGICSTLCQHSIDYILNRYGDIKRKECDDNKYKPLRKVKFSLEQGDVITFTYIPLQQCLKIYNETQKMTCYFQQEEFMDLGESFFCFFSMDTADDHIKFI